MISGLGGQDFNIRGVGGVSGAGNLRANAPVQQEDDDAAFRFLESWSSSPESGGALSLDKMLQLQQTGGSSVPQTVITEQPKPEVKTDDQAAAEIEFLIKTNRKTFQAHGALGSAGISDGWNLSH